MIPKVGDIVKLRDDAVAEANRLYGDCRAINALHAKNLLEVVNVLVFELSSTAGILFKDEKIQLWIDADSGCFTSLGDLTEVAFEPVVSKFKLRDAIMKRKYPIEIHHIKEKDCEGYFLAFHPDFGCSACSATGETEEDAINLLNQVRCAVLEYYIKEGKNIPEPSRDPLRMNYIQRKATHDRR